LDYKSWQGELKTLDTGTGGFEGYASLFGVRDDIGDVVQRGAFMDTLPAFIRDGFIADNHNWDSVSAGAIGTIEHAAEDDKGLFLRASYHSTDQAQAARRIAQERLQRNKSVGLSIGYAINPGGYVHAEDGSRHLSSLRLFEVSQVNVPMLRPAGVTMVKANEDKAVWSTSYVNDLPDSAFAYVEPGDKDEEGKTTPRSNRHFPHHDAEGNPDAAHVRNALARIPQSDVPEAAKERALADVRRHASALDIGKAHNDQDLILPFEDHSDNVRVAVAEWLERVRSGAELRTKEGRPISEARRIRMGSVKDSLQAAVEEIDALLRETAPIPKDEQAPPQKAVDSKLAELYARFQELDALHRYVTT
jgi:HK97 family phage prohead protease